MTDLAVIYDEPPEDGDLSFEAGDDSWRDYARCAGMGPGKFFPERGHSALPGAKVCAQCPVTEPCLQFARESGSQYGIWGQTQLSRGNEKVVVIPATPVPAPTRRTENTMIPKTLSATSIEASSQCLRMWEVQYLNRVDEPNNSAAALGTTCHGALEMLVAQGWHLHPVAKQLEVIQAFYDQYYWAEFIDSSRYQEGLDLCIAWIKRQDWSDREVLSTELKLNFALRTSAGEIPFNYIMDRKDRIISTGEIEVVDYKSISRPMSPATLRDKLQARAYGLAAQIEHPEAERIWVSFDLLRHDPIAVAYTKEDNRATWKHLHQLAERIIATPATDPEVPGSGPKETLGEGCRWCVRKGVCGALNKHVEAGGILKYKTLEEAAERLYEVTTMVSALQGHKAALEEQVNGFMRGDQSVEAEAGEFDIKISLGGKRGVDPERVLAIIGPDLMAKWGNITVTKVDKMLKDEPDLDDDQRRRLRGLFFKNYGDPKPNVTRRAAPVQP